MKSNSIIRIFLLLCISTILFSIGCVTKKKKGEISKLGKFYHNLTSEYNGYFNANELYKASMLSLQEKNEDNFSKIIELYDYISVPDPKIVNADLDKAIEKVTRVAAIHEPGDWVDDCYVLMAKSQYLKQDYEKAEETLQYFEEEFNPSNPFGKNFKKRKPSAKQRKRELEEKRKEDKKIREEKKEALEKEREEKKEALEKEKKERKKEAEEQKKQRDKVNKERTENQKKSREQQNKERQKQREQDKKDREKAREEAKKNKTKLEQKPKSKREVGTDSTQIKKKLEEKQKQDGITINKRQLEKEKKEKEIEEELKRKQEDENETTDNEKKKDKKKVKEDESKYSEGIYWLARTYIRRENYSGAEFALRNLMENEATPKDVRKMIPVAFAELHIKEKNYEDALTYLEEAIKVSGNKNDKARYAFVAGQLSQRLKNYKGASRYFGIAKSKAKDFDLKFMAILFAAKMETLSGGKTPEQAVAQLSKYLKETKYKEYKDQIYFAMGEMALDWDRKKSKEFFTLSSGNNVDNKSLKAETAYYLAELNLQDKTYNTSKFYYDTTLMHISKSDERYLYVKNMASNLTAIAKNVQIVERTDSLLAMSSMDKDKLMEIAKRRKQMEEKTGVASTSQAESSQNKSALIVNKSGANVSSSFFAYNSSSVEAGKTAFKLIWGNRVLEDNWRRKNKGYQANENNNIANETEKKTEENESSKKLSDAEFKRLMADVPMNPTAIEQMRGERKKALFELGKDYRDKLKEYQLSLEVLEKLFKEYPGFDGEAEALYYAYLDCLDLGKNDLANNFKRLLNSNHANDKFTRLANDPEYLAILNADAKKLDNFYDQSYELFRKAQYDKVIQRTNTAIEVFGKENKLMAKFSLLNAMCLGATKGKEDYIKALQELIIRYPKSNEEVKAKEILRFLTGDGTAFNYVDIKEVDNIFSFDASVRHYIAVVIMSDDADALELAKISVSEYNKKYHSSSILNLGEAGLSKDEGTQIIYVRSFENKDKAMNYYEGVMKSRDEYISNVAFELYPITQANYRKMLENKTHNKYRVWFEKNYLGK